MTSEQFLQYVFSGLHHGSIYRSPALGFTLIYNATDIINFAQGEFVMLGVLVAISFTAPGSALPLRLLRCSAVVTVVGVVFELLAIRPLLRAESWRRSS